MNLVENLQEKLVCLRANILPLYSMQYSTKAKINMFGRPF